MKALQPIIRRVRGRPTLAALIAMLAFLFAVFLAIMISSDPTWAYRLFGVTEKFRILEFVGVAMGGMLLAVGAAIANRRAAATENAARAQAEAAKAHAVANRGAEHGRRQERLKNAIEHLGHGSVSVRLGGAYELFHLAKDTEELRQSVMDILCAHIRRTTREGEYRNKHMVRPSEEIQSLLTLLFVEAHDVFRGCHIHLRGSWLAGSELRQAHLPGANLSMVYLQNSALFGACMQNAYLFGARLQESYLCNARLQAADLSMARLQRTILSEAHMQGTCLNKAQMQGADISGTFLQGATCKPVSQSSFKARIRSRIGRISDVSGAIFAGGLSREDVSILSSYVLDEEAEKLQRLLVPHVGQPAIHELPKDSGAIIGVYSEEDAERWIAEYEKAVGKGPKATG